MPAIRMPRAHKRAASAGALLVVTPDVFVVLNRQRDRDRWLHATSECQRFGVKCERFEAYDSRAWYAPNGRTWSDAALRRSLSQKLVGINVPAAPDQIVTTIGSIEQMAAQIALATAQQSEAVSEIRGHSERIHQLGDSNLTHISRGREQSEQMLQLASELDQATLAFKG